MSTLTNVPEAPTMSLHDIAAKLWVVDRDAYWNLRHYIEQRDRLIDDYQAALVAVSDMRDQLDKVTR